MTIDGSITVPSGVIQIQTINAGIGSVFTILPDNPGPGSFDIIVNGTLSAKGRWVNDFGATSDQLEGSAYTNGGSVVLIGAARQAEFVETATVADTQNGTAPTTNVDISGSILLNQSSLIDVSAGGYVNEKGALELTSQGGNVSLIEQTAYFQLGDTTNSGVNAGGFSAFRVTDNAVNEVPVLEVNPSEVTARVTLDGTIRADGFSGGGTFTLFTPEIGFGDGTATTGTELPMDFFSKSGFANFNITSYKTDLEANTFTNELGGYNAVLATQTLTVGDGQTLLLSQSMFSPVLDDAEQTSLRNLESGGDIYSVLAPAVPTNAWDQRAVSLTLGGLIELDVAKGGTILGAAGSQLTVAQLLNEGTIRFPGGTITQSESLPQLYTQTNTVAVHSLSEAFSVLPDGTINETDPSKYNPDIKNFVLAAQDPIYLLGNLGAKDGIVLAAGSVTDLSGESIVNPRAIGIATNGNFRDGQVIAGGTLQTLSGFVTTDTLFTTPIGTTDYAALNPIGVVAADTLTANAGAQINLAGAFDTFDRLGANGKYVPTPEWSDAGTLTMGNGGTLTGAIIDAHGGTAQALGGTLVVLDPVLYQDDPGSPTLDVVSSSMVKSSGFDTFVAEGSLSSVGDVTLELGRGFFLLSRPFDGQASLAVAATRDTFVPVVRSGGVLEIDAPYIRFASSIQNVSTPFAGTPGTNSAIFRANEIDISGALLFDQSVANVEFDAKGDVRLSGVEPWQQVFNQSAETVPNSLLGQLAVNGNLSIRAGQVYPTTGSTFFVTSSAADGTITFARSSADTPATPYSAGGNLLIQAANIVQGGVVRVPIGSLTLGASNPFTITTDSTSVTFAPPTTSLDIAAGSVTSVSADGMAIPYGTTTDQIEWFFAATGADELTAPPKAVLTMGGANVSVDSGSTVDISGGGDLYAYEFISGTGGSHDVLDRINNDAFSSSNGFQYPGWTSSLRDRAEHFEYSSRRLRSHLFFGLRRSLLRFGGRKAGLPGGGPRARARLVYAAAREICDTTGRYAPGGEYRSYQHHTWAVVCSDGRQLHRVGLLRDGWHRRSAIRTSLVHGGDPVGLQQIFEYRAYLGKSEVRSAGRTQRPGRPATASRCRPACSGADRHADNRHDTDDRARERRPGRRGGYQRIDVRHRVRTSGWCTEWRDRAHCRRTHQSQRREPFDRRRPHGQYRRHNQPGHHRKFDHRRKRRCPSANGP